MWDTLDGMRAANLRAGEWFLPFDESGADGAPHPFYVD